MSEILFRGFHKDKNGTEKIYYNGEWYVGNWVEGDLQQDKDIGTTHICGFNYYSSGDGLQREFFCVEVIPETIGQYVGLTDNNATKIFEGDIVKSSIYIGVVRLGKYGYNGNLHLGFYIDWNKKSNPYNMLRQDLMYWVNDDLEIIGNIYSNPKLLEVEE